MARKSGKKGQHTSQIQANPPQTAQSKDPAAPKSQSTSSHQKATPQGQAQPLTPATTTTGSDNTTQKRKQHASQASRDESPLANRSKKIKVENELQPTEPTVAEVNDHSIGTEFGCIVYVVVGPDKVKFWIHAAILSKASTFFARALGSKAHQEFEEDGCKVNFNSSSDGMIMVLSHDRAAAFERFSKWLYAESVVKKGENVKVISWLDLFETYIFAERRRIPLLQNALIDTIIEKAEAGSLFPNQAVLNLLWKPDLHVSKLRSLLLRLFAEKCNLKEALCTNSGYNQRFLHDLVIIQYEMSHNEGQNQMTFWERKESWYVNNEDDPVEVD